MNFDDDELYLENDFYKEMTPTLLQENNKKLYKTIQSQESTFATYETKETDIVQLSEKTGSSWWFTSGFERQYCFLKIRVSLSLKCTL